MLLKIRSLVLLFIFYVYFNIDYTFAIREYNKQAVLRLREEVRDVFQHAYDSYLTHAYPYDELRPLSCDGVDTWGSYSLTLIDALDTLAIMGNYTEFQKVFDIITSRESFDANINISVFETNIRLIGGLLSAHLLSHRAGVDLEPGWPCNGPLLRLAEDVAQRLIVAFDTPTGMPYGTVNLRYGIPKGETSITCTAGVGTFLVEFGTLSRLTGDPIYEEVAMHAIYALYNHRSPIGLVGNHIDVLSGKWVAQDSGIGAGVDSYFEYLVKGSILFQKPELMDMFNEGRAIVDKYLKKDDWYVWASMSKGQVTLPVFESLEAYWPGILSLIGDSDTALRILQNYHSVWKQYGFTPEVYNIGAGGASSGKESYPLRPELSESLMYLYRDTQDPIILQMGEDILRSLQHSSRTNCGYATIKDVRDHRQEDRMDSFFLAETTKYLYLLFDPDNFIHNPGHTGTLVQTPSGECILDVGGYIFNTEAHPIDPAALHCCHFDNKGLDLNKVKEMYEIIEAEKKALLKKMEQKCTNVTVESRLPNNISESGNQIEELNNSSKYLKPIDSELNVENKNTKPIESAEKTVTTVNDTWKDGHDIVNETEVDYIYLTDDNNSKEESKPLPPPLTIDKTIPAGSFLPDFIQDILTISLPAKAKCEPQTLLERIRKEKLYCEHPTAKHYHLLQTPAPSFLRRLSLAGEFLIASPKA